ncbi:MAG: serine/threonine protein kinase [Vicinamibacteraceae bacterium]|nr:serine/threonine protein kinase [Vicinamibacteraceae bacterium]
MTCVWSEVRGVIGSQLGNYRVYERIGEGGMGTVYRAMDVMLERNVALKFLHPDLARQPELVARFRAEAVVLARLVHRHIAAVFGLHKHEDDLYMAMEYVPGRTLTDHLKDVGRLTAGHALRLALDILDALEYAHEQGVVHRDIKSANVILMPGGGIKVMDFGIARVLGGERRTMVGTIVGTLGYMAPEQIQGLEIDGRADLYSLGVVLYEMLTGHVPFEAETEWALMQAQIQQAPTPPATLVEMPAVLEAAILRALAKAPADRFQSAREMRDALLPVFHEVATADDRLAWARANRESTTLGAGPAWAAATVTTLPADVAAPATTPAAWAGDETVVRPVPPRPATDPGSALDATRLLGTPVPVVSRSVSVAPPDSAAAPVTPAVPVVAPAPVAASPAVAAPAPAAAPVPSAVVAPASPAASAAAPAAARPATSARGGVARALTGAAILLLVAVVAGAAWWITQAGTSVPLPAVSAPSIAARQGGAAVAPEAPDASAIDNVPVSPRAAVPAAPATGVAAGATAASGAATGSVAASAEGAGAATTAHGTAGNGPAANGVAGNGAASTAGAQRFERVKLLRRTSQGDTLEVDGILVVEPSRIAVLNVNGTHPLLAFNVPNIVSATYEESSQRRVFVRTRRYWLTLATGGRNMEVRLTKEQAPAVIAAVERVLGRSVAREVEPE